MSELREMIKKYGMYLAHQGQDIGLRQKPDNIEKIKKLKPQLLTELKKIEEEEKIAGDPRVGQLSLSYYYGDWYRANSIFKTEKCGGNIPEWGNNENIFKSMELNRIVGSWFESGQIGYVEPEEITKKLEKLFGCDLNTKKEELQKRFPDLEIVMRSYDNMMQGKGEYVSQIIFPNFETFERYVQQAYADTIKATKAYKAKIDAIYKKAKETGEKQVIAKYPVDCDDEDEECNVDLIYEYAMPDGTREIERIHTY